MLPTPSTSHVSFDRIYEPAEDSFLFLDTLSSESESTFLKNQFKKASLPAPPLVLEVGVGSGVVLAFIAANARSILGRCDILTLGTDLNSFACQAASQTVGYAIKERNVDDRTIFLDIVNGDLATALRPKSVDILVFNPPYVPAELPDLSRHADFNAHANGEFKTSFEQDSYLLELSYAGGEDGMEVTDRMLEQIPGILSKGGVAYVLLCAQNKPVVVKQRIREWGPDWQVETVGLSGNKAGWEKLVILRIWNQLIPDDKL